jgi:hypothetical protein
MVSQTLDEKLALRLGAWRKKSAWQSVVEVSARIESNNWGEQTFAYQSLQENRLVKLSTQARPACMMHPILSTITRNGWPVAIVGELPLTSRINCKSGSRAEQAKSFKHEVMNNNSGTDNGLCFQLVGRHALP